MGGLGLIHALALAAPFSTKKNNPNLTARSRGAFPHQKKLSTPTNGASRESFKPTDLSIESRFLTQGMGLQFEQNTQSLLEAIA